MARRAADLPPAPRQGSSDGPQWTWKPPASPTATPPGRVFDFHSLRCELATLADAAGVSPRVVQRLMRHSKLEMTGRYTRPRAVDIEAAARHAAESETDGR